MNNGTFTTEEAFAQLSEAPAYPTAKARRTYGAVGGALCIILRIYLPIWDGVFVAILAANALARPIDLLFLPRAKRVKSI